MDSKRFSLVALLLALIVLCGCAGYFHYHPVSSTEQAEAEAGAVDESLFVSETLSAPGASSISGEPLREEIFIK